MSFSLSKEFNNTVTVDLKEISGTKFLHIIDNATRFSTAAVVSSKQKEKIVDAFIKHWIAIFGAQDMILSDNGGEFTNSLSLNMANSLILLWKQLQKNPHGQMPWWKDISKIYIR